MQVHAGQNRLRTWGNVDCLRVAPVTVTIKLNTELGRQTELGGQSLLHASLLSPRRGSSIEL